MRNGYVSTTIYICKWAQTNDPQESNETEVMAILEVLKVFLLSFQERLAVV